MTSMNTWGALTCIEKASFTWNPSRNLDPDNRKIATPPIPLPFAQNIHFVAYFTYDDPTTFIYDTGDWNVSVEVATGTEALETPNGETYYHAPDVYSSSWVSSHTVVAGMTVAEDALLTTCKTIQTGAAGDDVIKCFAVEAWRFSGTITGGYPFVRARLRKLTEKTDGHQNATFHLEAWADEGVWKSERNLFHFSTSTPQATQRFEDYWETRRREKTNKVAAGEAPSVNGNTTDIFGSTTR